jgi:mevalonate kinase
MKVLAPGKLILSGEHAVVYGHPALAMAVNRYASATATPQVAPNVSFDLLDLAYQRCFSVSGLHSIKSRIKRKYQRFVRGDFKIRDVLRQPFELAQIAFTLFFEILNIKLTQGIKIRVESTIPIGCGMGSSAATILSIVHAIANHLQVEMTPEMFLRLGLEAENMQHGYSSGLDLQISLYGGCQYMEDGSMHQRNLPSVPLYLVNTGQPLSSTGECVVSAASYFKTSSIGQDFAAVTTAMDKALQTHNVIDLQHSIRGNHDLLLDIGVVPGRVANFIKEVAQGGGAAKICGAGAVAGSNAGMVLVVIEDEAALTDLCARYHYSVLPVIGEARGVHVA